MTVKQLFAVRLKQDLATDLEKLIKKQQIKRNAVVNIAIRQFVDSQNQKPLDAA